MGGGSADDDPEVLRELAQEYYQGARFELAMRQFAFIVQDHPGDYEAILGLANSCREVGNDRYLRATTLAQMNRMDAARAPAGEGHQFHTASLGWFEQAKSTRPNDPRPSYGEGLLYYQRSSGAYRLFAEDEAGEIQTCARGAIRNFTEAMEHQADTPMLHRYVGLMMVVTGEVADAIPHLERYVEELRRSRQQLDTLQVAPGQQEAKERQMRGMDDELSDLQETLRVCRELAGGGPAEPAEPAAPATPAAGEASASFRRLIQADILDRRSTDGGPAPIPGTAPTPAPPR